MAIDTTKKVKKVTVDGALMPFSSAIDANIQPGNIKKDVTILGVTGTLESGGGTSKLLSVVDRSITELTANDLDGLTSIGQYAFHTCNRLTAITIPSSVTKIGQYAFYYCSGLTSITIPDSVTGIEQYAFEYCNKLTSVTIGNGVKNIGNYAFADCGKLTSITIGNSVTSIGVDAFYGCIGLTSITIPESVTKIGQYAFYGCSALTEMTILATTPPTLASTNAISKATTTIYIPAGTLSAYQTATNWSNFADKFVELSA